MSERTPCIVTQHLYRYGYAKHLARHRETAKSSAEIILPFIRRLLHFESILDVGCGTGTWLSVARQQGIERLYGIDGPWLDPKGFELDSTQYRSIDLTKDWDLEQRFDLVCCLEVASDIPAEFENVLIESLTRHGDAILFSSAIMPQHHEPQVNKRWQSYWTSKFSELDYRTFDVVRPYLWSENTVGAHYRQNCILFARGEAAMRIQDSMREQGLIGNYLLDVVHPEIACKPIGEYSVIGLVAIALKRFCVHCRRTLMP